MRMIRKVLLLLSVSVLLCLQIPGLAEENGAVPEAWGITFDTDDVLTAARRACLLYDGIGYWDNAAFQTVGIHVFSQEEDGDTITLKLYTAHQVYQVVHGKLEDIAGGSHQVLLSFKHLGSVLLLTRYQTAGDGSQRWDRLNAMFGEALTNDSLKNGEYYAALAEQDALHTAEQYLQATEEEKSSIPCFPFLTSGTNPKAESIVHEKILGCFPSHVGQWISENTNILYTLRIEGEQSYSGILTYASFYGDGERLDYVKVQVDGDTLKVLDGDLSSMEDFDWR